MSFAAVASATLTESSCFVNPVATVSRALVEEESSETEGVRRVEKVVERVREIISVVFSADPSRQLLVHLWKQRGSGPDLSTSCETSSTAFPRLFISALNVFPSPSTSSTAVKSASNPL